MQEALVICILCCEPALELFVTTILGEAAQVNLGGLITPLGTAHEGVRIAAW